MKNHVRRTIDVLSALGFSLDDTVSRPGRNGKSVYRHPYDPEAALKVWVGMSEAACIAVQRKANAIAETGHQGPAMPRTIGERNRAQRDRQRAERDRKAAARSARAEQAEHEYQERSEQIAADRHRREIEALMQPGGAR